MNDKFFSKKKRQIILLLIDIAIIVGSEYFSLFMRFNIDGAFGIPNQYMQTFIHCLPIDIIITIIIFWIFKLYHSVWTYASIDEIIKIFKGTVVAVVIQVVYKTLFNFDMPRSFYIMDGACLLIVVLMSRLSIRVINHYRYSLTDGDNKIKTMIIGAGSAGTILLSELARNHQNNNKVVCFIDDNQNKWGKYLQGIEIVGGRNDISKAVEKYKIEEIIIAVPSLTPDNISEITEKCNRTGCKVKILPSITSTFDGNLAKQIRDISYTDLLGRDPIVVDQTGIYGFITGKTVLVTGGGGSIGSELCRQIMTFEPQVLVIFDIYENNAYEIQMELIRKYPRANIKVLIGSVRDWDRLEVVFSKYKPDIIFHAAAHKHVPLMEKSPNEAIKNNCMGTMYVARLADKYKSEKFVLISTDKAVRPTNIMGASKRICEMIIQYWARKSVNTKFAAVRFGNVLGSNGSVIPLFLKQIEAGGPITVTHREITRFFMTIPEAVSLVLQAGLYAKGGEIFVLDMGKQVRIYDLAENLIRMKGYKPNEDIMIEVIGLRPGEKLYEEILMDEEGMDKTENNSIFIGQPIDMDDEKFENQLEDLIKAAYTNSRTIKEKTEELCKTYKITDNN